MSSANCWANCVTICLFIYKYYIYWLVCLYTGQKVAQYASMHLHNRIMRSDAFGKSFDVHVV